MIAYWYTDHGWHALLISIIALVVSYLSWKHSRKTTLSEIKRDLIRQATEINEAFLRHEVKSPYAHHLKIPDGKVQEYTGKAVMLLHQINLLREVYEQRKILGQKVVDSYTIWAATILRPWIESDEDIKNSWKLLRDSTDLVGDNFIKWLQRYLPIL
jgi:heme exporter protein D